MKPGVLLKFLKYYFINKRFDLTLLDVRDYKFSLENNLKIKEILLQRIVNIVQSKDYFELLVLRGYDLTRTRSIDQLKNRLNILDRMDFDSNEYKRFFRMLFDHSSGMDLKKPIYDR
jgi:hypothetical protein